MNSKQEELKRRTKEFAHRCVKLAVSLPDTALCRHIQGQLIRSSTSTAANYRAVCLAQTRKTFIAKLAIVIEECDESCFWMEFIIDENIIPETKIKPLLTEGNELTAIFIQSRKTASQNK
jgi:four helix bundle protein